MIVPELRDDQFRAALNTMTFEDLGRKADLALMAVKQAEDRVTSCKNTLDTAQEELTVTVAAWKELVTICRLRELSRRAPGVG